MKNIEQTIKNLPIILAVSGEIGAGKSVLIEKLIRLFNWEKLSVGEKLQRPAAEKRGIPFYEYVSTHLPLNPDWDTDIEVEMFLALITSRQLIVDARMGPWIKTLFKRNYVCSIKLIVDENEGAHRVFNAARSSESGIKTAIDQLAKNRTRAQNDIDRMSTLYGVENFLADKYYDIIVDTTSKSEDKVLSEVLEKLLIWANDFRSLAELNQ